MIPSMQLTNAHVATVVRSLAGIKGWSTNALAAQAGEPTPNFRRYFWTGERPIPLDAAVKAAAAFGMSTSELLRRAEQVEPEPFVEARTRADDGRELTTTAH